MIIRLTSLMLNLSLVNFTLITTKSMSEFGSNELFFPHGLPFPLLATGNNKVLTTHTHVENGEGKGRPRISEKLHDKTH
jgi:hypothetical protein